MLANLENNSNKSTIDFSILPVWQQSIISAINSLKYAAGLTHHNSRFSKRAVLALRAHIPFAVHGIHLPNKYVLLNRDYKPLGLDWPSYVDYEKSIHLHLSKEDIAIIKPHYHHFQDIDKHIDGIFFKGDFAPWTAKINARMLVERLEKVISDLNGGAIIV